MTKGAAGRWAGVRGARWDVARWGERQTRRALGAQVAAAVGRVQQATSDRG
jgi:hypothetical protein